MNLRYQLAVIIHPFTKEQGITGLRNILFAGRNCYASHLKTTNDSYLKFVKSLLTRKHLSPMEFADMIVDITTSRAVLALLTRHRLASFCVLSQRYIQLAKTGDITFIFPTWYDNKDPDSLTWFSTMQLILDKYKELIAHGKKPEEAREVLPNSTACRIIMKANLREWRHIFELRTSLAAYPQIRELMNEILVRAKEVYPIIFDDFEVKRV